MTPDTITIGVSMLNFELLQEMGLTAAGWGDQQGVFQALVDDLNANGGILGRKVVAVYDYYSPIDAADAERACTVLTQDNEVFAAVLGFVGPLAGTADPCFAGTNNTPLVGGEHTPDEIALAQAPWFNVEPSTEDETSNLLDLLVQTGRADGGQGVRGVAPGRDRRRAVGARGAQRARHRGGGQSRPRRQRRRHRCPGPADAGHLRTDQGRRGRHRDDQRQPGRHHPGPGPERDARLGDHLEQRRARAQQSRTDLRPRVGSGRDRLGRPLRARHLERRRVPGLRAGGQRRRHRGRPAAHRRPGRRRRELVSTRPAATAAICRCSLRSRPRPDRISRRRRSSRGPTR